jgi:hypothetical protein
MVRSVAQRVDKTHFALAQAQLPKLIVARVDPNGVLPLSYNTTVNNRHSQPSAEGQNRSHTPLPQHTAKRGHISVWTRTTEAVIRSGAFIVV